jgi:hypothetical protein
MKTAELETAFRDKFEQAGILAALNEEKSQFLDLSDSFFAEIVLNDGSKLAGAERIVRSVQEQLGEKGVRVDSIVRAVWRVKEIDFVGPARAVSGGLKAALEFEATLESGSRQCKVTIELTLAALNKLREKLALHERVGFPGWARDGDVDEDRLKRVVAEFLDLKLANGGESYWNPILSPKLELNEWTVSYLIPDTKAFQQLVAATNHFLGDSAIEDSLFELNSRPVKVKVHDFQRVLPELSDHLGGAFRPGEDLQTNALTLFQALGDVERERLRQYYSRKVEEIPEELKRKYPALFSNEDRDHGQRKV